MKISDLLIGMFVVMGVIITFYVMINNLSSSHHYDVTINDSYKDSFDKIDELIEVTDRTQTEITEITTREDTSFFTGTWDLFKLTKVILITGGGLAKTGFSLAVGMFTSFFNLVGVGGSGDYISAIVIGIFTVLLVGSFAFIILKRKW